MTDAADLTLSSFQSEVKAQIIEMEDRHSRMVQKRRPKEMQDILRVRIDIMRELLAYLGGKTAPAPEPEVPLDEDLDDSLD